jgi:hypothetical protein
MSETNEKQQTGFMGTYFDRSSVLRFARWTEILAWIVLGYHVVQVIFSLVILGLQISRGMFFGPGVTDLLQQVVWLFQPIVPGALYFAVIQGLGKLVLIFMDIEDNTRRAVRNR